MYDQGYLDYLAESRRERGLPFTPSGPLPGKSPSPKASTPNRVFYGTPSGMMAARQPSCR